MEIRIDFFRESGKWYSGGTVDIGEARLWKGDLPQAIIDNQNILKDGWQNQEYYYIVTDDLPENFNRGDYHEFFKAMFLPIRFKGLKKQDKNEIE